METIEDIIDRLRSIPDTDYLLGDTLSSIACDLESAHKKREAEYEKELAIAYEAVDRWNRNYLAEAAENVNLKHEISKLKSALQPVLECDLGNDDHPDNYDCYCSILEAQLIYNENEGSK